MGIEPGASNEGRRRAAADPLHGLRVLVTGATNGIGRLTAAALVARGVRVLIHGRSAERVQREVQRLSPPAAPEQVRGLTADLSSLDRVAALADGVGPEPLDALVNNAGVGFGADRNRRELSADGHELRFAVNYLAPVLLTERLLAGGQLRRAVVNVASVGQHALDFADLMSARDYEGTRAYRRSKLALIAWSRELAARQPQLVVHALHPGTLLDTGMVRDAGIEPRGSASEGAASVIVALERALVAPQSGAYFDRQRRVEPHPQTRDPEARAALARATRALLEPWLP